ncbi:MAG: DUF1905 domain-containing protein [Bacteroidota bacterium]
MDLYLELPISQLAPNMGGMSVIIVEKAVSEQFDGTRPRVKCVLNGRITLSAALNPLGNGDFYIIIAKRYLNELQLQLGSMVDVELRVDFSPLGVDEPEELLDFLADNEEVQEWYEALTDGKKRGLIHAMNRVKSMESKIKTIIRFKENPPTSRKKKPR